MVELVQRDRGRESVRRHEARHGARAGREVGGVQRGGSERDQVERDDRRIADERQDHERERAQEQAGLRDEQNAAPIDDVDDRPGAQHEHEDRDDLEEGEGGHAERRSGDDVDLIEQGGLRHVRADAPEELAGPQDPVLAVVSKRRDVEEDPPHSRASTVCR